MNNLLLLGDEAIAQGAIDGGISGSMLSGHSINRDYGICAGIQTGCRVENPLQVVGQRENRNGRRWVCRTQVSVP